MKYFGTRRLRDHQGGITIAELAITLPVAAIIIVALISILFNQYATVLAESQRANLRSTGQALLTSLQDELLFTIEYAHTLHEDSTDDHEPSGGWDYDTTPQTLIIHEIALDATRSDSDRNIVRERLNPCASSAITDNPVAINNIIYFVEDNPDNNYMNLIKRTVIPTFNLCSIDRDTGDPCTPITATCFGNARETSCPEASVGSGNCTKRDAVLSENVVDFSVRYFSENNVETTFPSAADQIEVTLVMGDRIYGRDVETTINHTIRKIN